MNTNHQSRPSQAGSGDQSRLHEQTRLFDAEQALHFLELLGKPTAATRFRSFKPDRSDGGRKLGWEPGQIAQQQQQGRNVYAVIGTGGDNDASISTVPALFVEWDDKPTEWQVKAWQELGLPEPSMQVHTGGKSIHCYWILNDPLPPEQWRALTARLITHCGSDPKISNPSRVMRLPGGTYYDKAGKALGQASIIHEITARYSAADIEACLPAVIPPPAPTIRREAAAKSDMGPRGIEEIIKAAGCIPARISHQNTYEEDRRALCGCAAALAEIGYPESMALELLQWPTIQAAEQALKSSTTRNAASFWAIARKHGYNLKREKTRVGRGASPAPGAGAPLAKIKASGLLENTAAHIPKGWWIDQQGNIRRTLLEVGDLCQLLRDNIGEWLGFNQLTMLPELSSTAIPEAESTDLYCFLSEHGYKIGKLPTQDALVAIAHERSFHPVKQYLETVEADPNLHPLDLDTIARDFLGVDGGLSAAMIRATLIGAVKRVFEPGCQFDVACTLKGGQGLRKTSFWKTLASPAWFTSTMPESEKDITLNIHSAWIFELAELESITSKRSNGALKNLITTSSDLVRVPYGRVTERKNRCGIFVGSVNDDTFLRDETGSRRWWVIEIKKQLDIEKLQKHRDAIWKAAVLAFRAGELPMLSDELQALSDRSNTNYEAEDPWLSLLGAWVAAPGAAKQFSSAAAIVGAGLREQKQISTGDARRAADCLKRLGYEQGRNQTRGAGGERARFWSLAISDADSDASDHLRRAKASDTSAPSKNAASDASGHLRRPEASDTKPSATSDSDNSDKKGNRSVVMGGDGGGGETTGVFGTSSETGGQQGQNRSAAKGLAVSDASEVYLRQSEKTASNGISVIQKPTPLSHPLLLRKGEAVEVLDGRGQGWEGGFEVVVPITCEGLVQLKGQTGKSCHKDPSHVRSAASGS